MRDLALNPKYTGYMVWNRRATKKGGKVNLDWVPMDLLIGNPEELIEQVIESHARWGITSYTVRADAVDVISPVLKGLR